jgi:hypothetical protein
VSATRDTTDTPVVAMADTAVAQGHHHAVARAGKRVLNSITIRRGSVDNSAGHLRGYRF